MPEVFTLSEVEASPWAFLTGSLEPGSLAELQPVNGPAPA